MTAKVAPDHAILLRDPQRLTALQQLALLDTPSEEAFDRLTRLASTILCTPTALVTLVDAERQFFKSCVGLPEPWASRRQTPLSHSFCQYVVSTREPLVVTNAREEPLLRDNLAIQDLNVIAYAGYPLVTTDGIALGSFCVIDSRPRVWTQDELAILRDLTASLMTEIELRAELIARETLTQTLKQREQELELALSTINMGIWSLDLTTRMLSWSETVNSLFDLKPGHSKGPLEDVFERIHPQDRPTVQAMLAKALETGCDYDVKGGLLLTQEAGQI